MTTLVPFEKYSSRCVLTIFDIYFFVPPLFKFYVQKMPIKKHTFILNDESVTNSYGFRVKNAGIDLSRFKSNPVMLDNHQRGSAAVIGKWENIHIEGTQLKADADFDQEDETAKKIQGKVDRGYIKGASIGLSMLNEKWELVDNIPTLTFTELLEASITELPSNGNALKLYGSNGIELSTDDIQLSVNNLSEITTKIKQMKQIQLSVAALMVLGLKSDQLGDNEAIAQAVEKLTASFNEQATKLTAVETERDGYKAQLDTIQLAERTALIDNAIKSGKITADKKEQFLRLAASDLEMCKGILEGIPAKTYLSATGTQEPGKFDAVKTVDDFQKLSADDKQAFKNENPEAYKQLFV